MNNQSHSQGNKSNPIQRANPAQTDKEKTVHSIGKRPMQVLIVGNVNVFSDGVLNLLSGEQKLVVEKIKYQDDASVLRDVTLHKPDVVVLIPNRNMNLEIVVGLLISSQVMARSRLVILSMETTRIEIYEPVSVSDQVRTKSIAPTTVEEFLLEMNKGLDKPL